MDMKEEKLIIVRGAGDISTGTIHRLVKAGFPVLALETDRPSAIRRRVAFSEAVYDGIAQVEDVTAVRIEKTEEVFPVLAEGKVPLLIDPEGKSIAELCPAVVVDAILAKKNLGTKKEMADLTIALGPGFSAGEDVHYVIETMRGHDLGRIISFGRAQENTGIPGLIGGYGAERVIHSPCAGIFHLKRDIGSLVEKGEVLGIILSSSGEETPVRSKIPGVVRGVIRNEYRVPKGFKLADVDPRPGERKNCYTISDKARCIAGSVLELICAYRK